MNPVRERKRIKYLKKCLRSGQNLRYIILENGKFLFSPNCCHKKGEKEEYPVLKEGTNFVTCKKCGTVYRVTRPSDDIEDIFTLIDKDNRPKEAIEKFNVQNRKIEKLIVEKKKLLASLKRRK